MNMMKFSRKYKSVIASLAFVIIVLSSAILVVQGFNTGRFDRAKTGCDCHSLTADPTVSVNITGLPAEYTPDLAYPLIVTVSGGPPTTTGGFNLEVSAGTLDTSDINVQTNGGRNQATHTNRNQRTWGVEWTAPSQGTGDVTFWVAGNAVNGDTTNSGDGWNLNSTVVPEMQMPDNQMILKQGWNLISIPLIQTDTQLSTILEDINGKYNAVQAYAVIDTDDPWKHNHVDKGFSNDLTDLNEKVGFWVHITTPGDTVFQYNGTLPLSNQTIPLFPGWNLVGFPSLESKMRDDGLNNVQWGTDVDKIQAYNATSGSWEEVGEFDFFQPERGYWVHSNVNKMWEVPL
jgi:hypothetical protein